MGEYALVAKHRTGLEILDVAVPLPPEHVSHLFLDSNYLYSVTSKDGIAYVSGYKKLFVADVSVPESPALLETLTTESMLYSTAVVGDTLMGISGNGSFHAYDISQPAAPLLLGATKVGEKGSDFDVHGDLAYVSTGVSHELLVVDISTLDSPQVKGTLDDLGVTEGVAAAWPYVWVSSSTRGLMAIDVSVPTSPTVAFEDSSFGRSARMVHQSGYLYLPSGTSGLVIADATTPGTATKVAQVQTLTDYAKGVSVVGTRAYVANEGLGVQVIDISNPAEPVEMAEYVTGVRVYDAKFLGAVLLLGGGSAGLLALDVSKPSSVELLSATPVQTGARQLAVVQSHVFITQKLSNSVQVYDISNPQKPWWTSNWMHPGGLSCIEESQGYVVTVGGSSLRTADVSDPANIEMLGFLQFQNATWWRGMDTRGPLAFPVEYYSGLYVVSVAVPSAPVLLGHLPMEGACNVTVSGDLALVANCNGGVTAVDLSDLANPAETASFDMGAKATAGISLTDGFGFTGTTSGMVFALDATVPAELAEAAYTGHGLSGLIRMDVVAGHLFTTSSNEGLRIFDVAGCWVPSQSP